MKFLSKLTISILFTLNIVPMAKGETTDEFPMPAMPDTFATMTDQSNYIVTHFWDRVKLNTAIKNREGFSEAFARYIFNTTLADYDVTMSSIDMLIKSMEKDPKSLLALGEIAEGALYGEGATIVADEYYLPFAKAVVKSKKLSSAEKARFIREVSILEGNKVGAEVPDLEFMLLDGSKGRMSDYRGKYVILFVNDPDCDDCRLARLRLSTDTTINRYLRSGQVALISLYPDAPDEEWRQSAASYNPLWVVGASDKADDVLDLRSTPTLYYINSKGMILSKSITPEQIIDGFNRLER